MKKYNIIILLCILIACVNGCSKGKKSSDSLELKTIAEVKENCDKDLEEAKNGKYKNLIFDDISIYKEFPNEISHLKNVDRIGMTTEEVKNEVYRLEKEFDNIFSGLDGIDKTKLKVDEGDRDSCEKFLKDLEAGIYKDEDFNSIILFYDEQPEIDEDITCENEEYDELEKTYRFFQTSSNHCSMLIRKQLYSNIGIPDNEDIIEVEKEYYKYTNNKESLNDKYKLLSGEEYSIKEVIDYVESVINNEKNGLCLGDKLSVYKVYARKKTDESYDLMCGLRREKDGMLFDYDESAGMTSNDSGSILKKYEFDYDYDQVFISVTGKEEWSNFFSSCSHYELEETGEKITKIISLDEALRILSENIGLNSTYTVESIEMSYLQISEYDNKGEYLMDSFTPKWRIVTTNNNDNKETKFFIDVQTGEIGDVQLR